MGYSYTFFKQQLSSCKNLRIFLNVIGKYLSCNTLTRVVLQQTKTAPGVMYYTVYRL